MMNITQLIKDYNKKHQLTAKQNLAIQIPAPGQLHRVSDFTTDFQRDLFYLVTEANEVGIEVIPGSFDSLMAGPNDIVLPKTVLGDYIWLALDMAVTMPKEALGEGFAILDDETYNRIIDSQLKFETGEEGEYPSFPFALPYLSKHDSCYKYHKELATFLIKEQEALKTALFSEEAEQETSNIISFEDWQAQNITPIFPTQHFALAAGDEEENPYAQCMINGYAQTITIEYSPKEKKIRIKCYDSNDELTTCFDGWKFVTADGQELGIITLGKITISNISNFDGKCCLIDKQNHVHILQPQS